MSRPRIGIDCRLGGIEHAGIGRYISELLPRLPNYLPECDWVWVCSNQQQFQSLASNLSEKIRNRVTVELVDSSHYSLQEQLILPRRLNRLKLDLLHVPHFNVPLAYRGPLIITIHDLLWHQQQGAQVTTLPAWKYRIKYRAYKIVVRQAVQHAAQILVPSHSVKNTIQHYYASAIDKTVVTPEGVSDIFQPNHRVARDTHHVLYVGSLYPHKNVMLIFQWLQQHPEWSLSIISTRDVFQEKCRVLVERQGLTQRVTFLGRTSDSELVRAYQSASVLIQPSLLEGFGLTGLEALACACPTVLSDIEVFHELYDPYAPFFDPREVKSLAAAIHEATARPAKYWFSAAAQVKQHFAWDRTAELTARAYRSVLEHPTTRQHHTTV